MFSISALWDVLWPISSEAPPSEAPSPPKQEDGQEEQEEQAPEDTPPKDPPSKDNSPEDDSPEDEGEPEEQEQEGDESSDDGEAGEEGEESDEPEDGQDSGEGEGDDGDAGTEDSSEGEDADTGEGSEDPAEAPAQDIGEAEEGEEEGEDKEGEAPEGEAGEGEAGQGKDSGKEGEVDPQKDGDAPEGQNGSTAGEGAGETSEPDGSEAGDQESKGAEEDGSEEEEGEDASDAASDEEGDEVSDGEEGDDDGEESEEEADDVEDLEEVEDEPITPPSAEEDAEELRRRALLSGLFPDLRHVGTTMEPAGLDPDTLERLVQLFSQDPYQRFIDMLGRMSVDAWMPARHEPSKAVDDVRDIVKGQDISKVLMSELVRFKIPALQAQAYADLAEGRLMQRQMEGEDPRGRGPIIVALDTSGSMAETLPGWRMSRMNVARLMVLGLMRIAQIQGRTVHICAFTHVVGPSVTVRTLQESLRVSLDVMSLKAAGGTEFHPPIRWACRVAKIEDQADILIITDGEAVVSTEAVEQANDLRRDHATRIFTMRLGVDLGVSSLAKISDLVVDLRSEEDMVGLTKQISQAVKK